MGTLGIYMLLSFNVFSDILVLNLIIFTSTTYDKSGEFAQNWYHLFIFNVFADMLVLASSVFADMLVLASSCSPLHLRKVRARCPELVLSFFKFWYIFWYRMCGTQFRSSPRRIAQFCAVLKQL